MSWDVTKPEDDDLISDGPTEIRTLKTDLKAAFDSEGSLNVTDAANPKYQWKIRFVTTTERNALTPYDRQLIINTTTKQFERYDLGTTSWIAVDSIADGGITSDKLAAAVAGAGLTGGAGTALSVVVDNSTIECPVDTLQVKDGGITAAKLAAAVAGDGLSNSGTALNVGVDNSTIEINSDALRVKDAGIVEAKIGANAVSEGKLATAVVAKLGQNIGLVSIVDGSANGTIVNYSGQGRLNGITLSGNASLTVSITIDGVSFYNGAVTASANGGDFRFGLTGIVFNDSEDLSAFSLKNLDIHFKTSLSVSISGVNEGEHVYVAYERQA